MANIGIDARMMGTLLAGIGRYVFELSKNLVEKYPSHHYYIFYNTNAYLQADVDELSQHGHVTMVPTAIRHYSVMEQLKFASILNTYSLDLVHFPNFNVPLLYKKPFIVTIHDVVHHKLSGHKKSRLLHFYAYKKIIEHAARASRAVITVSDFSRHDIARTLAIPEEKIHSIYEGTALNYSITPEFIAEVKKRYVLDKPYFLAVGTLERKKNVIQLARGFDQVVSQYGCDRCLVFAGKVDSHYPEIKHHAADIKNRDRLVFTGYIDDDELSALYLGAQAYVSASKHEGFGLPGVEAMKCALPLIVSNIEVFNEVYDNAAVYFNPDEPEDIAKQMNLVAQDDQFRNQLAANSLKRGNMFNWEKTAEETIKVYEQALETL